MYTHSTHTNSVANFALIAAITAAGLQFAPSAFAASGAPLPRCSADTQSFYLMRYIEAANGSNAAPKTILELATAPASGAVTRRLIWDGQTAPTPSARDLSKNAGATVAGGMGKDGYIYAMRAIGTQEQAFSNHLRHRPLEAVRHTKLALRQLAQVGHVLQRHGLVEAQLL